MHPVKKCAPLPRYKNLAPEPAAEMLATLESLHARVSALEGRARLETFWDIPLNIVERGAGHAATLQDQGNNRTHYRLRVSTQADPPTLLNVLYSALSAPVNLDAWLFPKNNRPEFRQAHEVVIREEIYAANMTNGMPGVLVVVKADLRLPDHNVLKMAIKFRRLTVPRSNAKEAKANTDTEKEALNAIRVQKWPSASEFFARPYFLCSFTENVDASTYHLWEGVAMEPLELMSVQLGGSHAFYLMAFQLLSSLHHAGFVHGDPHRGNLMLRNRPSTELVLIDWDHTWPLPQPFLEGLGPDQYSTMEVQDYTEVQETPMDRSKMHRMAAKTMIINDFNRLFYVANPFVPLFDLRRIPDPVAQASQSQLLTDFQAWKIRQNEKEDDHDLLFLPWPYNVDWVGFYQWKLEDVMDSLSTYPNYRRFLEKMSLRKIHNHYSSLFTLKRSDGKTFMELKSHKLQQEYADWKRKRMGGA